MFMLIRIVFLQNFQITIAAIVVGLLFVTICLWNRYTIDNSRMALKDNQTIIIKVQADDFAIRDDYFYGKARLLENNKIVLISGGIKNPAQVNFLSQNNHALLLKVNANIQSIEPATNFNQFDPKNYYEIHGITNSIKIKQIHQIDLVNEFHFIDAIHGFRQGLINYANQLPKPLDLYVASLLLGEMNSDDYDEIIGIKQLGLIHLFSISGFHVYYFISILERILIYLRWRREHYRLLIILVLPLYFVFSGASVGLLRAVLMMESAMIARQCHFKISGLDIWSIALLINLLIAPRSLLQFGSQMSYALSFALIFTSQFSFFRQTILLNLISVPFIIFHVYEWHLLTFLANLFILPLFSILIFPIVIIGATLYQFIPATSIKIAWFLDAFDNGINWLGGLPGNILFGKPIFLVALILFVLTLFLLDKWSIKKLIVLSICYFVSFLVIKLPIQGEIVYFDVGQGDSFLIKEPFNRSVNIIDTGGKVFFGAHSKQFKYNAEKTSINYLKSKGINKINNLFITHQDADHSGDLPAFLNQMKVANLIIPLGMQNNDAFMNKIHGKIDNTRLIIAKDRMSFANQLIDSYHPFEAGMGKNEDSLVLGTSIANQNWLFTGDLGQNGEHEVIGKFPNLKADVLKIGHHGSKTSSSPVFLDALRPSVAIISAGRNNRYGHPNIEVINKLKQRSITIYNTQLDGMIIYKYSQFNSYFETKIKR